MSTGGHRIGLVACASQKLPHAAFASLRLPGGSGSIVLAGEQSLRAVHQVPWPVLVPMQGLGIGQQFGGLTVQLNAGDRAGA